VEIYMLIGNPLP